MPTPPAAPCQPVRVTDRAAPWPPLLSHQCFNPLAVFAVVCLTYSDGMTVVDDTHGSPVDVALTWVGGREAAFESLLADTISGTVSTGM